MCGQYCFGNLNTEDCILYVPIRLVETYKSTSPWNEFNVQAIFDAGIKEILNSDYKKLKFIL